MIARPDILFHQNNPILIGPAGVGKTAILEGLAQRLVTNEVPESLKGHRLVSIDLSSLMAGSAMRGSFEEKMKALIADIEGDPVRSVSQNLSCSRRAHTPCSPLLTLPPQNVICFIDEIHQLLNLGKAEGSLDAGNMLKPALARGLQLAGATTLDEYRRTIEKDAALTRRCVPPGLKTWYGRITTTYVPGSNPSWSTNRPSSKPSRCSAASSINTKLADRVFNFFSPF